MLSFSNFFANIAFALGLYNVLFSALKFAIFAYLLAFQHFFS